MATAPEETKQQKIVFVNEYMNNGTFPPAYVCIFIYVTSYERCNSLIFKFRYQNVMLQIRYKKILQLLKFKNHC